MYSLKFLKKAKEELSNIDPVWQRRIKAKLEILAENPVVLQNQIKGLKGNVKGLARLRVGSYRIVFQKRETKLLIVIIRIAHRREDYKK